MQEFRVIARSATDVLHRISPNNRELLIPVKMYFTHYNQVVLDKIKGVVDLISQLIELNQENGLAKEKETKVK